MTRLLIKYELNHRYADFQTLFLVAIKNYGDKMSTFEQSEILDFPDVWFLGLEAKKIEGVPGAPQNNGTSFSSAFSLPELLGLYVLKFIRKIILPREGAASQAPAQNTCL